MTRSPLPRGPTHAVHQQRFGIIQRTERPAATR
jgi:hypothetical protein